MDNYIAIKWEKIVAISLQEIQSSFITDFFVKYRIKKYKFII